MKKKLRVENPLKFRFPIYFVLFFVLISCEPDENKLGINLFPPSDSILVYTDTLYNLETHLVESNPVLSSVNITSPSATRTFLLGTLQDSITGISKAEIVTQMALTTPGNFGTDPLLDSITLKLHCTDIVGDTANMRILIHEFTGDISIENNYYSNYDVTGLYDPVPLVDEVKLIKADTIYEFIIDNQDFLDRIGQAIKDSSMYNLDSFQNAFKGLYITTEQEVGSNTMAKIGLTNSGSRFGFEYVHDSVDIDSVTIDSWGTYYFNFSQYFSQKLSIFHHDFSGTELEQIIDNPDVRSPILYVQGMAGVNVEIAIPEFEDYITKFQDGERISINGARLVFEVVPDSISGISTDDYPAKLMVERQISDSTSQVVYDYVTNGSNFGNLSRSNSVSAFLPPLYQYKFNLGLHYQTVLSGDIEHNNLILSLDESVISPKIIKLWSNDSDHYGSLRLELIYTKF